MLTVAGGRGQQNCEGVSRRDALRIGTLALGGLSLPQLLATRAAAGGNSQILRDKSVVLLYLSGGASHIETFDPKMTAPSGVRSVTGEVKTPLAGVTFGGTFPQLAARADKLAVVRSFSHGVGSHVQAHAHVLSGGTDSSGQRAQGFSMGSAYARVRGANHPQTGLPTYLLLTEDEVDNQYANERGRITAGSWPGLLGPTFAPFQHQIGWQDGESASAGNKRPVRGGRDKPDKNPLAANMQLRVARELLDDRFALLRSIDNCRRDIDASGAMASMDKFSTQALDLILGGAAAAFDYRQEDPRLIERYDTSGIQIGHKKFRPSTLGRQMLLARRLCESGVGFVTVHSAGWDMHADGNNPGIVRGMEMLGRSLDQAVSAFLDDVHERGLSEKILLIITGDFGRTPKVNARGGRDHWSRLGTLALAGGGLPMGQVIGSSARGADIPASNPVGLEDVMATVMHTLFDVGQLRLESGLPPALKRAIERGQPIAGLV